MSPAAHGARVDAGAGAVIESVIPKGANPRERGSGEV